ncbi:hypothetical protein HRI_004655200 [Hibiscus trionum]|uniref:Agglutinin domain-containing protein n=1 Tax=Hibiscus trionum TaxID=183268 RepID=A0A9W7J8A6_HIBTR|nr:hypothetical protein HRI_004655200 [Hibiscus trionum]
MASLLPRYIVIESSEGYFKPDGYVSYIREDGEDDGFLRYREPQVTSPYAKFEVESSETEGQFHIRSCQNNKYWQRTFHYTDPWGYWIAANSKKKGSKDSSTLFKFIPVAENTFRIMHVESGYYVCWWRVDPDDQGYNPKFNWGLSSRNDYFDDGNSYLFKIIDWSSLMILPRYVAFRGPNNKYLCLYKDSMPYYGSDEIGEETVAFEILPTNDGNIRIKSFKTGKFFRCVNSRWIWADDTSTDNVDTFFRAVKFGDQKIGLIYLGNNNYCKRLTDEGYGNALAAVATYATNETEMMVEEPVLTREIYDVRYDLDNSRVYGEEVRVLAQFSATNITDESSAREFMVGYTDIKISSWKTDLSLKLGTKTTMKFDVPFIFEGKVEMSAEVRSVVEWGEVSETITNLEFVHNTVMAPMSEVTVNLVATKALCDVPFTYKQRDVLHDGSSVLSEVKGGTYYGSNYHSVQFVTKEEKLSSSDSIK